MTNLILGSANYRTKQALFEREKMQDEEVLERLESVIPCCESVSFDRHSPIGSALQVGFPLVDLLVKSPELRLDNTHSCMQIGNWHGIKLELHGQIEAYTGNFPEIEVFVCRRDDQSFDSLAKDLIFVVLNLILYGLNPILNHNVE